MTLCFLTYCLFCHHNSTWLHLNKHVIYCTCRLESSKVICSHSEKTSFPYAACYTERVVGFARVGDFPKGYRTKLHFLHTSTAFKTAPSYVWKSHLHKHKCSKCHSDLAFVCIIWPEIHAFLCMYSMCTYKPCSNMQTLCLPLYSS